MKPVTSNQTWIVLGACLLVSALASLAAVLMAVQRPLVVVVQPAGAAITPVSMTSAAGQASGPSSPSVAPPAAPPVAVTAVRMAALPALDDPFDPGWAGVTSTRLQLQAQQVAAPMLDAVTIPDLSVQAARDDARIAWRVSWSAPQPATHVETSAFTDALAIQFPLAAGAPFTMGAKGKPVAVLHWKALWQKDIDEGFQDVHDLYPNAHSDMYWFATGAWPFPVAQAFADERSRQWLVGVAAGNPMSRLDRTTPLEEIVAEGFGTVTTVKDSPSRARGQWKDGRWTVVIDRPLSQGDPLAPALQSGPGGPGGQIAFAVWDGQGGNVAGRKHYVGWVPFKVEP